MVNRNNIKASNAKIVADTAPNVVVSVGGTSGIGKASLVQLLSLGLPTKVYIVGRNESEHKPLVQELRRINSRANIIWLEGQISLLTEVLHLCGEIRKREETIDLLLLSAGYLPFGSRQETSEGIEKASAVAYYARMLFITQLLPLLSIAALDRSRTYVSRVINIFGAGKEASDLLLDDLSLEKPGSFNLSNWGKHVGIITTLTMRKLAEEPANQGVVLVHHFPGTVSTGLLRKTDSVQNSMFDNWFSSLVLSVALKGLKPFLTLTEDAGVKCLYLSISAAYSGHGVPLGKGADTILTLNGKTNSSLFSINENLEAIE